jgi:hypothetical protein
MSWEQIDDKHKKAFDKNFVSCEEYFEKNYIIKTILEHYPNLTRVEVEAAIIHCCITIPAPHPRKSFFQCVARQLGMEYN